MLPGCLLAGLHEALAKSGFGRLRWCFVLTQVVLSKPTPDARVEDGEFEENEAWALDIVLSTGEGKPKARALAQSAAVPLVLHLRQEWLPTLASQLKAQHHEHSTQTSPANKAMRFRRPVSPLLVRQVLDEKETMVFKRALDVNYHLKMKASRALFSEINTRSARGCTIV